MTENKDVTPEETEYSVDLVATASVTVRVTASDPDEAIDKAYEEMPGDVCGQCSGWRQKWTREWPERGVFAASGVYTADGKPVWSPGGDR